MTRAEAVSTGQSAATMFGRVFVVYRLPGWRADVFGCRKDDPIDGLNLPKEAELFERLAPGGNARVHETATAATATKGQDRLLFEDAGDPPPVEELEDEPMDWAI